MVSKLSDWEITFEEKFQRIEVDIRQKPGALLSIIPGHEKWDDFLKAVKTEWQIWQGNLGRYLEVTYPSCLVVLYGGLAFYEYNENTLWPQFARAVGIEPLTGTQQSLLNIAFSKATEELGLKIYKHDTRTDYIGSAVYYIGIPLSLWDGFLEICEWAKWRDDWKTLSNEEWKECAEKRSCGRTRLKKFLIDNREAASIFIHEMLNARERLLKNVNLKIEDLKEDLKQVCLLRPEYFDEVPETADFLREDDPESLFKDHAQLVWDSQRSRLSLYLPGVAQDKLPATWNIGPLSQKAAATSDELILDSAAFDSPLLLRLESEDHCETQHFRGLNPYGLFDLERGGRLINSDREQFPLRNYLLVSGEKIEEIYRKGFDEEENPVNEPIELSDGTPCFVTNLWPIGKSAELSLTYRGKVSKISFRTNSKIEARFFIGECERAANFSRIDKDKVKITKLPTLCLVIPCGYFNNNEAVLNSKFRVLMDDKPAHGKWERKPVHTDEDKEFYVWNWSKKPFLEKAKSGKVKDFKKLAEFFRSPNLHGDRILSIESPEFSVEYKIYLDHSIYEINECWENLPGDFFPWFLLCQSTQGMRWEDLMLAKDIIAPHLRISYRLLKKYSDHGLLKQQGRYWMIAESRATIEKITDETCLMQYCGDPSIIWGLYRRIYHRFPNKKLPIIEVANKKGGLPYLQMSWSLYLTEEIEKHLKNNKVILGQTLWNH